MQLGEDAGPAAIARRAHRPNPTEVDDQPESAPRPEGEIAEAMLMLMDKLKIANAEKKMAENTNALCHMDRAVFWLNKAIK